jgi:hypothetical protein
MLKNKSLKISTILFIIVLLSVAVFSQPASALISQTVNSWYTNSDTNVAAIAVGDVNGDGLKEIVTGGYYNNGVEWVTQLGVWNGPTLLNSRTWFWTQSTQISSIAVANITGGTTLDIITAGSYFDGTRWIAQLCVWNGSTLALENVKPWYWIGDTEIASVTTANITGSSALEIITGGAYFDGTRWIAQLCVWNGSTLALENVKPWYWTSNTTINSVAAGDIYGNGTIKIVTGGTFFDGTRQVAQMAVWNGSTLAFDNVATWYWTGNTEINSVVIANVTGGSALTIVTGGDFNDGTRYNAQLAAWNGSTLALQNVWSWYQTSNTMLTSLAVGNYSGGTILDIITAGGYFDGTRNNGQLIDFNGATFAAITSTNWFQTSDTIANSVAIGNFGLGNRVVSGGSYFDNTRSAGQFIVWG